MKTVMAKIVAFVMALCLLALPLTSEAAPHACQKQSHMTHCKASKACHKEDVPDCCKKKNGTGLPLSMLAAKQCLWRPMQDWRRQK